MENIEDDTKIAECFNKYFLNITESLGLSASDTNDNNDRTNLDEMVTRALEKYKNHPITRASKLSKSLYDKMRTLNSLMFTPAT